MKELHSQRGPLTFSVPPAIRAEPIRHWCEWIFDAIFACNKQLSSVILQRCRHLVVRTRSCSVPPTLCVYFYELGGAGIQERYLILIRGAGTLFPCVPRHFNHFWSAYWIAKYVTFCAGEMEAFAGISERSWTCQTTHRFLQSLCWRWGQ